RARPPPTAPRPAVAHRAPPGGAGAVAGRRRRPRRGAGGRGRPIPRPADPRGRRMSTADDVLRMSAADLAAPIAARELSAVEVAQAHLDRIAAVDERVHAFLHV